MSRNWLRVARVTVGSNGNGVLIENLRIQFEVVKSVDETPNSGIIKIFNLHPNTIAKIINDDDVLLECGYADSQHLVFTGNIKYVYHYRDKTDIITEIEAGDGDIDYRKAVINETLAAGATYDHLVDKSVKTLTKTKKGHVNVKKHGRLRGKVVSGNTRDVLRDVSLECGANWSIQDGALHMISVNDVLPGDAIVFTSETGMLGSPEINDKGIAARCLLNPLLRVNGTVKLDNNNIRANRKKTDVLITKRERLETNPPLGREDEKLVKLSPDGIYKILKLTHRGDTRAQTWESVVECIALGEPIPETR